MVQGQIRHLDVPGRSAVIALDGGGLAGGQAPTGFAPVVPLGADGETGDA